MNLAQTIFSAYCRAINTFGKLGKPCLSFTSGVKPFDVAFERSCGVGCDYASFFGWDVCSPLESLLRFLHLQVEVINAGEGLLCCSTVMAAVEFDNVNVVLTSAVLDYWNINI